jgi:ABC-type transport system involved in cytochrome bd biosynthesis fused ATPase/permease subunit
LDKYLWSKELEQDAVVKLPSDSDEPVAVKVECAFFKWDSKEEKATLSNINLAVNRGSFVTVVGKVGAGKSSLIASLLGEMPKLNGTVIVSSLPVTFTLSHQLDLIKPMNLNCIVKLKQPP